MQRMQHGHTQAKLQHKEACNMLKQVPLQRVQESHTTSMDAYHLEGHLLAECFRQETVGCQVTEIPCVTKCAVLRWVVARLPASHTVLCIWSTLEVAGGSGDGSVGRRR